MPYPNVDFWSALKHSGSAPVGDRMRPIFVVDSGEVDVISGRLLICDPFVYDADDPELSVAIPPGRYRVAVTCADVSREDEEDHIREAYATLIIDGSAEEVARRIITPLTDGEVAPPEMIDDEYYGFPVDAGTACFVDAEAMNCGARRDDWSDLTTDETRPGNWFTAMDDPDHIRPGIANALVPTAEPANIILVHSGWGDGSYPIIGGYDAGGRLIRVHIDFMVVWQDDNDAPAEHGEA